MDTEKNLKYELVTQGNQREKKILCTKKMKPYDHSQRPISAKGWRKRIKWRFDENYRNAYTYFRHLNYQKQ